MYIVTPHSMDKDNQDVHQELNKLRTRIQEKREQIVTMPGIDMNPDVQQKRLRILRDQNHTKKQLLHKYKGLCMFDIPKSSWCVCNMSSAFLQVLRFPLRPGMWL